MPESRQDFRRSAQWRKRRTPGSTTRSRYGPVDTSEPHTTLRRTATDLEQHYSRWSCCLFGTFPAPDQHRFTQ